MQREAGGQPVYIVVGVDLVEVKQTFLRRAIRSRVACELNEAGWFTHVLFFYLLIYSEW